MTPLAPLTTLGVGGAAAAYLEAATPDALIAALRDADGQGSPVLLLGGGSNLVISDGGFPGLVLAVRHRGIRARGEEQVIVRAAAGEPWDDLVAWTTARGLAGLECLAGIPGLVGATPIQNVGAYGQEVADTLIDVTVWDRQQQCERVLLAADCAFGYRSSAFKGPLRGRFAVLSVRFGLHRGAPTPPRQGELQRRLAANIGPPTPEALRLIVMDLRRAKGMVYDPGDPDTHSAGSFFVNPVVSVEHAQHIADGVSRDMPRYPVGPGRVKLAAAWLIERAGYARGFAMGRAALSSRHALAITNRGGASAAEVVALARHIQAGVRQRFGVSLEPEPVLVGLALDPESSEPGAKA